MSGCRVRRSRSSAAAGSTPADKAAGLNENPTRGGLLTPGAGSTARVGKAAAGRSDIDTAATTPSAQRNGAFRRPRLILSPMHSMMPDQDEKTVKAS